MATNARRFAQQGIRLVGGCCRTRPEHIRQMKAAIKQVNVGKAIGAGGPDKAFGGPDKARPTGEKGTAVQSAAARAVPRAEKSQLAASLAAGRFATVIQLEPPKG